MAGLPVACVTHTHTHQSTQSARTLLQYKGHSCCHGPRHRSSTPAGSMGEPVGSTGEPASGERVATVPWPHHHHHHHHQKPRSSAARDGAARDSTTRGRRGSGTARRRCRSSTTARCATAAAAAARDRQGDACRRQVQPHRTVCSAEPTAEVTLLAAREPAAGHAVVKW